MSPRNDSSHISQEKNIDVLNLSLCNDYKTMNYRKNEKDLRHQKPSDSGSDASVDKDNHGIVSYFFMKFFMARASKNIEDSDSSYKVKDHKLQNNVKKNKRHSTNKFRKRITAGIGKFNNGASDKTVLSLVMMFSVFCYLNSLHGEFVHDDLVAITSNPDVTGKNSIRELFKNDFWGSSMEHTTSHKSYRPLTIMTFRLNAAVFGLETALSFHAVNVILHCIVVALFLHFCREVLAWNREASVTAALLFASHPIHTEAVCNVVGRADVLCCIFYLLALISCTRESTTWQLTSLLCAALALLAKEPGVTVLMVCFVYQVLTLIEKRSKSTNSKKVKNQVHKPDEYSLITRIAVIATTMVMLVYARGRMLHGSLPQFSKEDNPTAFTESLTSRLLTFLYLPFFNLWLLLCPSTLSYDWQMGSIQLVESLWDIRNVATVSYLTIFVILLLKLRARHFLDGQSRWAVLLSICLMIFPFLPASNMFFTVGFVVAERVLYIPSLGFCLLVTHGLQKLIQRGPMLAWICRISLFTLLVLFTLKTITRNSVWSSRESLFKSGLESAPENAKVHYNYANYAKDIGDKVAAIEHYSLSIKLWPNHASSHNNLGTLLDDTVEAERHFREALRIQPQHAKAHYNLASLYSKKGRHEIAKTFLLRAIQLDQDFVAALSSLATHYGEVEGKLDDAEKLHIWATDLEPHNSDALNNYGTFLDKTGRREEAVQQYEKAIAADPNHTVAIVNAAIAFRSTKRSQKAEELYMRALEIREDPRILDNLGLLYITSGRYPEAKDIYTQLLERYPSHNESKLHYAQLLIHERSYDRAEELLLTIGKTDMRNSREIYQLLSSLYSLTNRTMEALDYILKALNKCTPTDSSCGRFYAEHGDILKDMEDYNSAEESYKIALSLDSNLARAHLNLAVIYHIKGNYNSAKKHYEVAYSLDSSQRVLLDNMKKLQRSIFPLSDDKCLWGESSPYHK